MSEAVTVGENDNGSQVTLGPGQELVVRLGSNPSTGYRWQVEAIDEVSLQQVGMAQYTPVKPGETPLPGQAGQETLRFQAVGPGEARLELTYRQPWEGGDSAERRFNLRVVVR